MLRSKIFRLTILSLIMAVVLGKFYQVYRTSDSSMLVVFYGLTISIVLLSNFAITYVFYRDPYLKAKKNPVAMAQTPLVTCLVAVFNEEVVIEQCIRSLVGQTYQHKEVIFVND